ncbi:MAG TPA: Uma2 family endonuclease [Pyrinomonadaceae bacterium]|nr:Uma2 family endonuclease [Pyrinomonadaceae bacterium]
MSLPQTHVEYTVAEYLDMERDADERHEFLDGQIYAMAGESPQHGAICMNLSRIISTSLLGTQCQAFSKDMKVRSGPIPKTKHATKGLFSYPDLLVVCGELKFHDRHRDVLLNPSVIVEVLSPTTEGFDRGEKWMRYQTWLPELTEYLLVSQSKPQIEHYHRRRGGGWIYTPVNEREQSVRLYSVDCALRLADVYDRLTFPVEEEEDAGED